MTLADHLKLNELPLATTPGGKAFTLKALHPSEHTIRSARVPGGNKPSVAIACDMIETIPIENANSTVSLRLVPNIVCPATIEIRHTDQYQTEVVNYGNFYNAAFGGSYLHNPTHLNTQAIIEAMAPSITQYRITSQSMTVELVAPTLRDQGTITAAQYDCNPMTCQMSNVSSGNFICRPDVWVYPEPLLNAKLLLGTSAYTSQAREGCYMPLRLTKLKWFDFHDTVVYQTAPQVGFFDKANTEASYSHSNSLYFPYFENRAGTSGTDDVPQCPKLCGSNVGVCVIKGNGENVAIRVRVRQVVEIVALPSTTYAPLLDAPLPPDDLAMRMYFEISGRMKDAYPASYNDLGKLFETITSIGKQILPYIDPVLDKISKSEIPVISGYAGKAQQVIQQTRDVIDMVRGKGKKQNPPLQPRRPAPPPPKVVTVPVPTKSTK